MAIRIITVPDRPDAVGYVGVPAGGGLSRLGGPYSGRREWAGRPVLTYDGRQPLVDGVPVERDKAWREAFFEGVDAAASRVFGFEWAGHLSHVSGLTPRTTGKDRVEKNGLPLPVLQLLARANAHPTPRSLGFLMLAVSHAWKDATADDDPEVSLDRMSSSAREELGDHLRSIVDTAIEHVEDIKSAISAFKNS